MRRLGQRPRASILLLAYRSESTIGIAARSALRQTVRDLELIIVGDGVDEGTRAVALQLAAEDRRVRFLDFPKGANRGETHRDVAVGKARSDAILYLADDDILLPTHVENLLELLDHANFVQSSNGYINANNELELFPADLADPACIAWHLVDPPQNAVSITGTGHSLAFYRALDRHWDLTPHGIWTDLHMWRAFMVHPDFRGATSAEMTTLQFPASVHGHRSEADMAAMMAGWDEFSRRPGVGIRMAALLSQAQLRYRRPWIANEFDSKPEP